jgi:CBS domain-containing protein
LIGVFTDGDFRRLATSDPQYDQRKMDEVMIPGPKHLNESASVPEIMQQFQQYNINCVLITNDSGAFTGLVDLQDMPKLKLL